MTVTLTLCALISGQIEARPAAATRAAAPQSAAAAAMTGPAGSLPATLRDLGAWGIRFRGSSGEIQQLERGLSQWLQDEAGWGSELVEILVAKSGDALDVRLKARPWETDTLALAARRELNLRDETLRFTTRSGTIVTVPLVSQKEVLAALLQRGRLTEFPAGCCTLEALRDHLALRQSIVRWSLQSDWVFPDSGSAVFNKAKWTPDRTTQPGVTSGEALRDFFQGPQRYAVGCRTSCKVQVMQGIFDFARREDRLLLARLEATTAGDPLADVEPRYGGRDGNDIVQPGRFVDAIPDVAWNNWVPGDWGYIKNTDPVSSKVTGDEGKNTIYIGRGLFAPNYRVENHAAAGDRPLDSVLYDVYSWRGEDKTQPRSPGLIRALAETPDHGGLLEDQRFVPRFFPRAAAPVPLAGAPR